MLPPPPNTTPHHHQLLPLLLLLLPLLLHSSAQPPKSLYAPPKSLYAPPKSLYESPTTPTPFDDSQEGTSEAYPVTPPDATEKEEETTEETPADLAYVPPREPKTRKAEKEERREQSYLPPDVPRNPHPPPPQTNPPQTNPLQLPREEEGGAATGSRPPQQQPPREEEEVSHFTPEGLFQQYGPPQSPQNIPPPTQPPFQQPPPQRPQEEVPRGYNGQFQEASLQQPLHAQREGERREFLPQRPPPEDTQELYLPPQQQQRPLPPQQPLFQQPQFQEARQFQQQQPQFQEQRQFQQQQPQYFQEQPQFQEERQYEQQEPQGRVGGGRPQWGFEVRPLQEETWQQRLENNDGGYAPPTQNQRRPLHPNGGEGRWAEDQQSLRTEDAPTGRQQGYSDERLLPPSSSSSDDLEGLNGNIVDERLLDTVHQIIDQHERQQKRLQLTPSYPPPPPPPPPPSSFRQTPHPYSQQAPQQTPQETPRPEFNSSPDFQKAVLSTYFTQTEPHPPPQPPHHSPPAAPFFNVYSTPPTAFRPLQSPTHHSPGGYPENPRGPISPGGYAEAETPRPIYGVPLAPVISLDSNEQFVNDAIIVDAGRNGGANDLSSFPPGGGGYSGHSVFRRRVGIVRRLR